MGYSHPKMLRRRIEDTVGTLTATSYAAVMYRWVRMHSGKERDILRLLKIRNYWRSIIWQEQNWVETIIMWSFGKVTVCCLWDKWPPEWQVRQSKGQVRGMTRED